MQEITYDYTKMYEDYFTDYEIPTAFADISNTTVTGSGTEADPYIINSTEDFLFMTKQSLLYKYIELGSDIVLNDETFDENGEASGGDGNVYTWQPITKWSYSYFNGNGQVIKSPYFNDQTTTSILALFTCSMKEIKNLKIEGVYFCGNTKISSLIYYNSTNANYLADIKNVDILSGTIRGNDKLGGICFNAKTVVNCSNRVNIIQHSTATAKADVGGLFVSAVQMKTVDNCVNYGDIVTYSLSYCGGISCNASVITNCKNYGDISYLGTNSATGVGGIIGCATNASVSKCINYGEINANASAGICGYVYKYSTFTDCINYADLYSSAGICNYGRGGVFENCKNYGTIYNSSALIGRASDAIQNPTILNNCVNYGDVIQENNKKIFGIFIGILDKGNFQITNCSNFGNLKGALYAYSGLIGITYNGVNLYMKNITHKAGYDYSGTVNLLGYEIKSGDSITVDGLTVDVQNADCQLFGNIASSAKVSLENANINCKSLTKPFKIAITANNLQLKNLIIHSTCPFNYSSYNLIGDVRSGVEVDGLLYTMHFEDVGLRRRFIGTNFSSFFVKWQTGRIGLKTMEAVGSFYGSVDEGVLEYYGYSSGALVNS